MSLNVGTAWSYAGVLGLLLLMPALVAAAGAPLWAAAVLEPVLLTWILIAILPTSRRVKMQSWIEVACTPDAAYWLVSDPRNWYRYVPELEVVGPVDVPTRIGSVIHCRVHLADRVVIADETVTACEPGRRFETAIQKSPHSSTGAYEFSPSPDGTAITYRFTGSISPLQAALGGWLLRGRLTDKMRRRRDVAMLEIRRLLEGAVPSPV